MLRTACSLAFVCALAGASPVSAQETGSVPAPEALPAPSALSAPAPSAALAPPAPSAPTPSRPRALLPLYATFTTLQALDYASTTRAMSSGAGREANPVMRSIVENRAAFIAVKAAAAAGVIVVGEKLWKKNRVGAVLFVAGANAAVGVAVARNYRVR